MLDRARLMKDENGFTLIELLIVIVILGVLSAVVVFSVGGVTDRGKAAACAADLSTVRVAGEAYIAKNGTAAADLAALVTAGFLNSAPTGTVTYAPVAGPPAKFTATNVAGACA